jgi:multiple sugar transport system permease protein
MKNRRNFYIYLILSIMIVFILFPYIWTFLTSIKNSDELFTKKVTYIPQNPTLDAYRYLIKDNNFIRGIMNSLIVSIMTSALAMLISVMAGYAFSRYRFKGRNLLLGGVLILYFFPQVFYLIPLFTIFKSINILGTHLCLVVSYITITIPFSIWLMTGFINEISLEIEHAARIDGANLFQGFIYIIFPLLRPGLVASGSYVFVQAWNEYLFATMFGSRLTQTIVPVLASFIAQYNVRWDLLTAGGVIAVIPTITIFLFTQKNLTSGLTSGSVKG